MELTRFIFLRCLAFIYFIGFLIAVRQFKALAGNQGLLPVRLFVKRIDFWDSPSLFYFFHQDTVLQTMAWVGLCLAVLAFLGVTDIVASWISVAMWFLLWLIYLSFVNVGQTFYGFGWETLLLETGFLAIFLGPAYVTAPVLVLWLMRWILFRVMFGAGLIKLRGDPCWRDLTCMQYHYETQPLPGPLSWYFHYMPAPLHHGAVLFNHFVELIVPFGFFGPRWVAASAGIITILFQTILIFSGNLSWLNVITIVLCIACFDDGVFHAVFGSSVGSFLPVAEPSWPQPIYYALVAVIGILSIQPTINLFSSAQLMNSSFEPLHLVNTYGAFGSITRERNELIIEGTDDLQITDKTEWHEYGFKGKPGDVNRRPPQVTPYHYKLDWQMWFAAMSEYYRHPWLLNLISKMLQGQEDVLALLKDNPFPKKPPQFIRVRLYRYHFTKPDEPGWWRRELIGEYLPPLSLKDPRFRQLLDEQGWLSREEL